MAKGENIFKRKDGRWEARYVKDHDPSGKILYGFCYGRTYKEAKEKVTARKAAVLSGGPVLSVRQKSGRLLASCCDQWLQANQGRLKPSTLNKYETILERHIKPELGQRDPALITAGEIDGFAASLAERKGLAAKTVKDILVVLHAVLKYAGKQTPGGFPAVELNYPKVGKKEMRVLSKEEQARLVAYLLEDMDACKFGILLALLTGLRIGEVCALQWKNISMRDQTLRVCATMQRLKNTGGDGAKTRILISSPKSSTSERTIPLTEYAAALCRQMHCGDPEAFILTGSGAYMEPRTLQYRLGRYTQACGLKDVHFHTLRHTFATRCVEVDFEIKSLSEILGHASTTITLDRYVHSSIELKRRNMDKLSAVGF